MSEDFSNFTFGAYARLLEKAAERYRFIRFGDDTDVHECALWRHDIDFSPHRALAMAEVEAELGLTATYFVQLTSPFYNVFESGISTRLKQISRLGHEIGIHFEPAGRDLHERLSFEAKTLSVTLDVPVRVFSLHNPTVHDTVQFDNREVAGLVNASASAWRRAFAYCSDSNGLWRYRTLAEVIEDPESKFIYALTHPEWWQDQAMPPRVRIDRCIAGRAAYCDSYYDGLLEQHGRPNIGLYMTNPQRKESKKG